MKRFFHSLFTFTLLFLGVLTSCNTSAKASSPMDETIEDAQKLQYTYIADTDSYTVTKATDPIGTITIPETINGKPVTAIDRAFHECGGGPYSLILPDSITKIASESFNTSDPFESQISGLEKIQFGKGLRKIQPYTFPDTSLKTVSIPGTIKKIGTRAFTNNIFLTTVRLEYGVKSIGNCAFGDCPNLKKIYIPSSVTTLEPGCLYSESLDNYIDGKPSTRRPTIYCSANSAAHKYVLKNKLPYVLTYDVDNRIKKTTIRAKAMNYNTIQISWKKVPDSDGYRIYRNTTGKNENWSVIKDITKNSTTTYQDHSPVTGKTYYYSVKAYRIVNGTKQYSRYRSNIVSCRTILKTPTITKVSSRTAQFQWNKVSGATGYQLWRANSPDGLYKRIQVSKTTSAKDTTAKKGKTYYYKIRAYRKINDKYVYSKCTDVRKLTIK